MSATQTQAEAAIRLATEQELPYWAALSGLMRGWSLALQGEGTAGITEIAQSLAAVRTLGQKMSGTLLLSMLAEAYGRNGQREAEQTVLTEALELVDENDERAYDARVYQLQGELAYKEKRPNSKKRKPPFRKLSTLLASKRPNPSNSAPLRA